MAYLRIEVEKLWRRQSEPEKRIKWREAERRMHKRQERKKRKNSAKIDWRRESVLLVTFLFGCCFFGFTLRCCCSSSTRELFFFSWVLLWLSGPSSWSCSFLFFPPIRLFQKQSAVEMETRGNDATTFFSPFLLSARLSSLKRKKRTKREKTL